MIFTFGEEFGWRGYLLPRLAPLGGISAAIITGVIWGLWHTPVIVLDGLVPMIAFAIWLAATGRLKADL